VLEPLAVTSPLDRLTAPAVQGQAGVTLCEVRVGTLTVLHGPADMLAGLPREPGWAELPGGTAIWTAPGQWLLLDANGSLASVDSSRRTDLTGARCVLEMAGPRARETLATVLPLDLHPRAFPEGAAAATVAGHVPVLIWRTGEVFRLACHRSFAFAFAEALLAAGRARGLALLPPC
jgi:sarcosine oxidase subunit gamma